jgi:dienelactone hydrolase
VYRNPTPGKVLVLQIPGMHRAKVRRNVVYQHSRRLRMDVYRPRGAGGRLPAVLIGGDKGSGQKIGWAQLIAASGMAAVAFDTRPGDPRQDVRSAVAYVRSHAKRLGIDAARLCTLGFSGGSAPASLWATTRDASPGLRCNVLYYAPLDLASLRPLGGRIPPMLVVKAGRDGDAVNESIDRFQAAARDLHADVRVVTYADGANGFDVGPRTARAKAVVRETLRFLKARLAPPLAVGASCATRAERASTLRFFAADDTPLAGLVLGHGSRGVVISQGLGEDVCSWLGYARRLAATGRRVLAYQARTGPRIDLDVAAAAEALRRTGSEHVELIGSSRGATAALIAAASLSEAPAAVVSLSGPESFGPLHALPSVRRLHAAVFFAAAHDDEPFATDAPIMYAASPSTDRRLEIRPGLDHGLQLLDDRSFRDRVTAFIAAH